jgi:hypothetical protein
MSLIFTVKNNPNKQACAFTDSGWNAPSMPHMGLSSVPAEEAEEKEVA